MGYTRTDSWKKGKSYGTTAPGVELRKLLLRYRVVTAVFKTELDYCGLEDHHGELIALIEGGAAARLRRLVDTHWRLVIRGHVSIHPGIEDLAEALRL